MTREGGLLVVGPMHLRKRRCMEHVLKFGDLLAMDNIS
jgi:hypothetical protein